MKATITIFVLLFSGISLAYADGTAPTVRVTEVNSEDGIIAGRLDNLNEEKLFKYSVALYLQTDNLSRHPFVLCSLAEISPDGEWESEYIECDEPKVIAAALVEKGSLPPESIINPNSIESLALTVVSVSSFQ